MDREQRKGFNEAVFREVNERVREVTDTFSAGPQEEPLVLVCECADPSCVERIELPRAPYERVRSDATWFVVVSGHEQPEAEELLERIEGYAVVRKRRGGPAEVAERTDPRA